MSLLILVSSWDETPNISSSFNERIKFVPESWATFDGFF